MLERAKSREETVREERQAQRREANQAAIADAEAGLQQIVARGQPLLDLMTQRQKELAAVQHVITQADVDTDPRVLAQAMMMQPALERILGLMQPQVREHEKALAQAKTELAQRRQTGRRLQAAERPRPSE